MKSTDSLIVGGGIIGLAIAFTLAGKGWSVVVIDADEPGQASLAAAGMLAPLCESQDDLRITELLIRALRRWPSFIDEIKAVAGMPVKINGPGMIRIALNDSQAEELVQAYRWQKDAGLPLTLLDTHQAIEIEPNLTDEVRLAVLTTFEPSVDPKIVLPALKAACIKRGVDARSGCKATAFVRDGNRVVGVVTTAGVIAAENFIIAAGAWSTALLQDLGYSLPVQPVRGQVISFGPFEPPLVRHTVFSDGGYLVPRPSGYIVAGATEETVGFDAGTTEVGQSRLRGMAEGIVGALRGSRVADSWAGLRPVSSDRYPAVGRVPGWSNVWTAAGHGRNGILFAPLTGLLMADAVLAGKDPEPALDPLRFAAAR